MERFWENLALADMTPDEWEALCDGCGRCCLHKFEDEDSGEILYTDVACRLLDLETCTCSDYTNRAERVADCMTLTADNVHQSEVLPASCAYRRLAEGHDLSAWHPLVSGVSESVREAGIKICGFAVSEQYIHPDEIEHRIIELD